MSSKMIEDRYYYSNNLHKKKNEPVELKTRQNFCFWSDLLGFGDEFFKSQWNLSCKQKKRILKRLRHTHNIFLDHTIPLIETDLILNDGLVKVSEIVKEQNLDLYGFFIRECVYTHNRIKVSEIENGFPGSRSILTCGESFEYLIPEVRLDDYALNYTKKDPKGLSSLAQQTENPIVVYNPKQFQMNTAFSKAYILDSLGKKHGIEGSYFYIDKSVLDISKKLAKNNNHRIIEKIENREFIFLLDKGNDYVHWGFKFDRKIDIEHKGWKTIVYRLKSFYPPDERITEFEQEVEGEE